MRRKKIYGVFAKDGEFTTHEKRKLMIYVVMVILGAFFVSSIRQYIDPIVEKYGGLPLLVASSLTLIGLYYFLDMKKY